MVTMILIALVVVLCLVMILTEVKSLSNICLSVGLTLGVSLKFSFLNTRTIFAHLKPMKQVFFSQSQELVSTSACFLSDHLLDGLTLSYSIQQ